MAAGEHEYASFYPWLAALMLMVLIAEIFIPEVKKRKRRLNEKGITIYGIWCTIYDVVTHSSG